MEQYKNLGGSSDVSSYEIGKDFIRIKLSDGSVYLYNNQSAGKHNIETMKQLAIDGQGLNEFINTKVRKLFARKES